MLPLVFIVVSFALLAGFVALAGYEAKKGVRFYADRRARLDSQVERIEFILAHIDLGAFIHNEVRGFVSRLGHDIVHVSLLSVRAVERLLTRVVRHQHAQKEADAAPVESTREYVKTLSDFKEHLEATRPEMPDIHSVEPQ
jgi:hypothetical protein